MTSALLMLASSMDVISKYNLLPYHMPMYLQFMYVPSAAVLFGGLNLNAH